METFFHIGDPLTYRGSDGMATLRGPGDASGLSHRDEQFEIFQREFHSRKPPGRSYHPGRAPKNLRRRCWISGAVSYINVMIYCQIRLAVGCPPKKSPERPWHECLLHFCRLRCPRHPRELRGRISPGCEWVW